MRAVIGIALFLAVFDHVEDAGQAQIACRDVDADGGQAGAQVGLASLIAHRDDAGVADKGRADVFVGLRVFQDRAGMKARFVGESAGTDIRGLAQGQAVQDVVQHPAVAQQALEGGGGDAGFKGRGVGFFEQQGGDQTGQVGIAAAFTKAVERALDLSYARVNGGERVGDGVAGVVVAVNAQAVAGEATRDDFAGDAVDF